jgi:hypothetical protein
VPERAAGGADGRGNGLNLGLDSLPKVTGGRRGGGAAGQQKCAYLSQSRQFFAAGGAGGKVPLDARGGGRGKRVFPVRGEPIRAAQRRAAKPRAKIVGVVLCYHGRLRR